MVLEALDGIEDDGDRVMLGKLALCEDVVNAKLEVLVKYDLKGREHRERYRRCHGGENSLLEIGTEHARSSR